LKFYSTNKQVVPVSLKEAVLQGLAADNGLFMPEQINQLSKDVLNNIDNYSFPELSFEIAAALLKDCIDLDLLKTIIFDAVNFEAPVVRLDDQIHALELYHGPSLAFKDFGARFMARLMSHFVKDENRDLHILVATSGDTGGAVALGFYNTPGIKVTILYPKGKVSPLQELQLTTLGANITALEVDGVFDDCQHLVKQAFLDEDLRKQLLISSANSINISRLIPQIFYYFEAYKQMLHYDKPVVMSVPSGNFGNLTAGLIGQKMGLGIHKFIAAVNNNDSFYQYLKQGVFSAKPSVQTLSTAMDVGNPSNLARINDLHKSDVNLIKDSISTFTYTDEQTSTAIVEIKNKYGYVADPHGAVGYLGLKEYLKTNENCVGVFQETAHPSKFLDIVEPLINEKVEIPESLKSLQGKPKLAQAMSIEYNDFRNYLESLI